jgi:hypothetical protein
LWQVFFLNPLDSKNSTGEFVAHLMKLIFREVSRM